MKIGHIKICLVVFLIVTASNAEVKLPEIFSSNMVFQQKAPVVIWGTADEGEKVTVELLEQKVEVTAKDGTFIAKLEPVDAGGPYEMKITGKNKIVMGNILFGEVWVCSGQSNMAMWLKDTEGAEEEIKQSTNDKLRYFYIPRKVDDDVLFNTSKKLNGRWYKCVPSASKTFSAVAYYFGKTIQKQLDVPVGIIDITWGGTPIEAWSSAEALGLTGGLDSIDTRKKEYEDFLVKTKEFEEKKAEAAKEGKKLQKPESLSKACLKTVLFNSMVYPVIPFTIKGVTWYQGESNTSNAKEYKKLLPNMIGSWRKEWGLGDFPFLIVQLAPLGKDVKWAELRDAQLDTIKNVKNTALIVTSDIGDRKDVHPKKKKQVGERLALAARALAYKEDIEYSGPLYSTMKVDNDKIIISFEHIGSGLEAKDGELRGFTIIGEDKNFVPAEAVISGNNVIVSSSKVKEPVAVRFGWAGYPDINLFNKEGLPASPFRTDDFELTSK